MRIIIGRSCHSYLTLIGSLKKSKRMKSFIEKNTLNPYSLVSITPYIVFGQGSMYYQDAILARGRN